MNRRIFENFLKFTC